MFSVHPLAHPLCSASLQVLGKKEWLSSPTAIHPGHKDAQETISRPVQRCLRLSGLVLALTLSACTTLRAPATAPTAVTPAAPSPASAPPLTAAPPERAASTQSAAGARATPEKKTTPPAPSSSALSARDFPRMLDSTTRAQLEQTWNPLAQRYARSLRIAVVQLDERNIALCDRTTASALDNARAAWIRVLQNWRAYQLFPQSDTLAPFIEPPIVSGVDYETAVRLGSTSLRRVRRNLGVNGGSGADDARGVWGIDALEYFYWGERPHAQQGRLTFRNRCAAVQDIGARLRQEIESAPLPPSPSAEGYLTRFGDVLAYQKKLLDTPLKQLDQLPQWRSQTTSVGITTQLEVIARALSQELPTSLRGNAVQTDDPLADRVALAALPQAKRLYTAARDSYTEATLLPADWGAELLRNPSSAQPLTQKLALLQSSLSALRQAAQR